MTGRVKLTEAQRRLTPVESLAREICWAGFTTKCGRAGKTKASYWNSLPSETRGRYIMDAKWFAWVLHRVPVDTLNKLRPEDADPRAAITKGG